MHSFPVLYFAGKADQLYPMLAVQMSYRQVLRIKNVVLDLVPRRHNMLGAKFPSFVMSMYYETVVYGSSAIDVLYFKSTRLLL